MCYSAQACSLCVFGHCPGLEEPGCWWQGRNCSLWLCMLWRGRSQGLVQLVLPGSVSACRRTAGSYGGPVSLAAWFVLWLAGKEAKGEKQREGLPFLDCMWVYLCVEIKCHFLTGFFVPSSNRGHYTCFGLLPEVIVCICEHHIPQLPLHSSACHCVAWAPSGKHIPALF